MTRTLDEIIRTTTVNYLSQLDHDNLPTPKQIADDIVSQVADSIMTEKTQKNPLAQSWRVPTKLGFYQIGMILLELKQICRIATGGVNADPAYDLLAVYQESGFNEGVYITDDEEFRRMAREYSLTFSKKENEELMLYLRDFAPRVERCKDPDLIPINNGIFNYRTKILEPFDPSYVFLSKSRVDYNPAATNVVIHNSKDGTDWDVESWMNELSDDPEVVQLLWEILGAIIRPFVSWNKSAWFYSEMGNNGKGTLCELMRQICGEGTYASIPLSDMGKDFMLEPLTHASAIIVDENDVGTFIDKAANLKAIITNDVLAINRKFKNPIAYQFYGFMVQCLNEMPRVKDKSDSFFRRQLFIPFTKCFTGKERKYIKDDYLHRREVLEYVLYKVLHMNYYELSCPVACEQALAEYREYNDPIRQFADEIFPQLSWDLVPFGFLYNLYQSWYRKNFPDTRCSYSKQVFKKELLALLPEYPDWKCDSPNTSHKPANKMDCAEPLIKEYVLKDWMNPMYSYDIHTDVTKLCRPALKMGYKGILRVNPTSKNGA